MEGGVSNGSKDVDEIDSCHLKAHGAKVLIACAQSESDACTGGVRESMSAPHKPPQSTRFFGAHEFGLDSARWYLMLMRVAWPPDAFREPHARCSGTQRHMASDWLAVYFRM